MYKKIILICGIIFSIIPTLVKGTHIEIGIGTKSQSMGGAFVAICNDASATYWNPAGLGFAAPKEIRFMHWILQDISNLSVNWFSLTTPIIKQNKKIKKHPVIGISWFNKGAILEEGEQGIETKMTENTISLSCGMKFNKKLSAGVSINRFSVNSDTVDKFGLGFDFGILASISKCFNLGFLARNISSNLGDEDIPTTYRTGIAIKLKSLILSYDISTKNGVNKKEETIFHRFFGIDWLISKEMELRVGSNDINPINIGFGCNLNKIIIEYAYSGRIKEGLRISHRIELGYKF